ncbi:hypothetical protein RvY_18995 [Ramazzottius varieornatus]|uniref:Uncharacterized protein n=1 Tax=Ramazzottius varieornatus TaxID=947166 RepID=A0A1D1W7T5_RAMVA|nr:hypothetical protein RvY_18995 [Ramazzottius varieornatus]
MHELTSLSLTRSLAHSITGCMVLATLPLLGHLPSFSHTLSDFSSLGTSAPRRPFATLSIQSPFTYFGCYWSSHHNSIVHFCREPVISFSIDLSIKICPCQLIIMDGAV